MYQTEWFGIRFSEFARLSMTHIAGETFYSKFYNAFYQRYHAYEDLPESWRKSKDEVAFHLGEIIKDKPRILAIGCGNGYIEHRLLSFLRTEQMIVAVEPNVSVTWWIHEPRIQKVCGFFPQAVVGRAFDIAYASNIDYCFDDTEYQSFLDSVREFGIRDFVLTNVLVPQRRNAIAAGIKDLGKRTLHQLGFYDYGQFWGYLREPHEHRKFLAKAGFEQIQEGRLPGGSAWFRAFAD